MNVNPVVFEQLWIVDDQTDGQEVPVFQLAGGFEDVSRCWWIQLFYEFREWHAGDEIGPVKPKVCIICMITILF